MRTTWVVAYAFACATAVAPSGRVDAGPEEERAQAQVLFRQGRDLAKQGKDDEACDKYREALALDHNAIGAILNVASCEEKAGKVASAARLFADARDRAREQQDTDSPLLRAAGDHIAQLAPDIPYIAIAFAEPPTPDTKLVVDDEVVPLEAAGHLAVDPGTVTIVVSRPGRVPYETKLQIDKRQTKAIAVPPLALPIVNHVVVDHGYRTAGKALTLAGGGLLVGSIITGAIAKDLYNLHYKNGICFGSDPVDCRIENESTKANNLVTIGNVMTVVGSVGVAATAVGAYLWLFHRREERVAVLPTLGPDQAGLVATGRF
jgi:hypothetical protein